jgi:simple sugar transport system permease protein
MESVITGVLWSVLTVGAIIVFAGIGEIMAERTGVLNIGIEGIMAMGGAAGVLAVNAYFPNVWFGLLGGALIGGILGALFALAAVTLKANQLLVGLAFSFIGNGLAEVIAEPVANDPTLAQFQAIRIPMLADIPLLGEALFNHNVLVYIAYFVLPVAAYLLLFKTRHGLAIRAVGQDPAAADASGISVHNMRFLYTTFAGMMFGIAGAYLTLALTRSWIHGVIAGRGWIVLTLVFFSRLSPTFLVFGSLLFGGATSLAFFVQVQGVGINSYILGMLPYIITLLLILLTNLNRRRSHPVEVGLNPASLAQPYHRE